MISTSTISSCIPCVNYLTMCNRIVCASTSVIITTSHIYLAYYFVGDSFTHHNGIEFSTSDEDHDTFPTHNCATSAQGGWWYVACHKSNLNGNYYLGGAYSSSSNNGMEWRNGFRGPNYSLKMTEIKMRPTA